MSYHLLLLHAIQILMELWKQKKWIKKNDGMKVIWKWSHYKHKYIFNYMLMLEIKKHACVCIYVIASFVSIWSGGWMVKELLSSHEGEGSIFTPN